MSLLEVRDIMRIFCTIGFFLSLNSIVLQVLLLNLILATHFCNASVKHIYLFVHESLKCTIEPVNTEAATRMEDHCSHGFFLRRRSDL